MEPRIYLNNHWYFTPKFDETWLKAEADFHEGEEIRIPHTCKETPLHYFDESEYQMVCGYGYKLYAKPEWKGKVLLMTFEGAGHVSEVYVNGKKAAEHRCGYTAFTVDLSDKVVFGKENSIVVKLNTKEDSNIPPFGFVIDYMTYGGIYRNVYLEIKNPDYIEDVFVKPSYMQESAKTYTGKGILGANLTFSQAKAERTLRISVKEDGSEGYNRLKELACPNKDVSLEIPLEQVKGWYLDKPNLYRVKFEVLEAGTVVTDVKEVRCGFRKAEFLTDGFYLNGEKIKIRGLNRHQSFPYVGYAMPKSMQVLDADILKNELGVNAVRTSHYPQSQDFIDRCDELGLLVFTEFVGWQHIGNEEWKEQALINVKDMICQYRNHASIILWGVRINESVDDDAFYEKTNALAHELDSTRQTGGVRALKKSHLLEDVYTYNDFSHTGDNPGVEPKTAITPNPDKPYLVSEYNGHMFPTKMFDCEEHRVEHAIRHANVIDAIAGEEGIAGGFGWCMFDYNTHKDFGSGDRICYHGVMDMFRNPKLAAAVYASQSEEKDVLEISSSMDIGEHPACNRGKTYIFTNADSVRMYKNDILLHEYTSADSKYKNMKNGPIEITDFMGNQLEDNENFKPKQAKLIKTLMNYVALHGMEHLPLSMKLLAAKLILVYRMRMEDAIALYTKYVGDWGGMAKVYRFDAIKEGKVVKSITKAVMQKVKLSATADHTTLKETEAYDVAAIRIKATDEYGNCLPFFMEPVKITVEGAAKLIGPDVVSLHGGMGGAYIKTTGESGKIKVTITNNQAGSVQLEMQAEGNLNKNM
ncbi:MAG: glycoside hydrolase family 2 protein [Lachnospiraceae bacterium]|nr:glycoside hydrolase family 2 protein [Lachnospiraceae bacterium]